MWRENPKILSGHRFESMRKHLEVVCLKLCGIASIAAFLH